MGNKTSIDDLIQRAKLAAHKLGLVATGIHRQLPREKRQFEIRNIKLFETKWSRLDHLEAGSNPWRMATVDHQLSRVVTHAKTLGLVATGNHERRENARYFEVKHPDGRTKFTTLRHLQDKKDPFGKQSPEEIVTVARVSAKDRGLELTGRYVRQGSSGRKVFEVITPSGRAVFMQPDAIRRGFAPRISLNEQVNLAKKYSQSIGLSVTEKVQRTNSGAWVFEVTNGKENAYAQLSHLKLGKSPWNAPFKTNARGYFYIYEIVFEGCTFLGFGITNNYQRRHSDHLMNCRVVGARLRRVELIQMHGALCLQLETSIKRFVKAKAHLNIPGFKTESAPYSDSLLNKILTNAAALKK